MCIINNNHGCNIILLMALLRYYVSDLEPSVVVGHDWGGCISWTLASRYPALVKKAVVLNCPHPLVIFKFAQTSWRQLMKSWCA